MEKTVITLANVGNFVFGDWQYHLPANSNSRHNASLMGKEFDVDVEFSGVSLADVVKHAAIDYKTNWMNNHRPKRDTSKDPVKAKAKYDADMKYLESIAGTTVVTKATGGSDDTSSVLRALAALTPEQREALLAQYR